MPLGVVGIPERDPGVAGVLRVERKFPIDGGAIRFKALPIRGGFGGATSGLIDVAPGDQFSRSDHRSYDISTCGP